MYLAFASRTGHFNWADQSEESTEISITVGGIDPPKYLSLGFPGLFWTDLVNIDPARSVDRAVELIEQVSKRLWVWTGRADALAFRDFLLANRDALCRGVAVRRLAELRKQEERLLATIALVSAQVDDRQEEAAERRQEMRDELRVEHDRQIDNDVRRAEQDYLNPRD